jgi:hypothetical protein
VGSASLSPELPSIEFDSLREPEPGGVESSGRFAEQRGRWEWIAMGACLALLAIIVIGGHGHATQETLPVAGAQPEPIGRTSGTTLDRPVHFTDRRATLSPPTDIGVDPLSPAKVLSAIDAMGIGMPELILGRYEDEETGLTLDPAWIVIDRGVVTSELESDGVTHTFHSTNVVRVVNAVTGRVVFTFPAPSEPVIMAA